MASHKITLALILFLTLFTYSNARLGPIKETELTVYFQDYSSGPNATVIECPPPSSGLNFSTFGAMFCADDPITEGFEDSSALIARGRGLNVISSLDGSSAHVMLSIVFIGGKYNGSSIEIYGNDPRTGYREVPVVGGTGKFRLARGYATFETLNFDPVRSHATIRSNLTVLHY
ncbi:hypothetical protein SASPL_152194 [Salvia splendens]|uniref:Dirigent protein n=1 Tax=Salvia splendens TaxID=180675 RepID=A0A8X8YZT8_SALSN|nr:hypothetical protein SASPL_152194 [Salvia splendens]